MPATNTSKHSPTQASVKKPETTTYNQTHSLQHAQPHHDFAQVIAISSGKGGVGKTVLAAPYLLLTITEEPTSLTDAFSLLRVLKKYQFHQPVLVIVNMTASVF